MLFKVLFGLKYQQQAGLILTKVISLAKLSYNLYSEHFFIIPWKKMWALKKRK